MDLKSRILLAGNVTFSILLSQWWSLVLSSATIIEMWAQAYIVIYQSSWHPGLTASELNDASHHLDWKTTPERRLSIADKVVLFFLLFFFPMLGYIKEKRNFYCKTKTIFHHGGMASNHHSTIIYFVWCTFFSQQEVFHVMKGPDGLQELKSCDFWRYVWRKHWLGPNCACC